MTIVVKFMKKPSTVQVISHKNQALISSKVQRKRISKIGFIMGKIYTETTNPRIHKGQQTHTLIQTMIVYIIIIQKKKPSATQRTHRSNTLQKRPEEQQKATQELRVFQKLKL